MYLRHLFSLIFVSILWLKEAKAYSITFQSVTCNILSVTLTLESWEYQQGSYITLYSSIQDSTNANNFLFEIGLGNQYTSTSLSHQIKFINNRVATFAGRSSVAIGITDIDGKLLPYLGSGDPDIATLTFSAPQGCSTPLQSTTSSSTYSTSTFSYTTTPSFSTSTISRTSSSISTTPFIPGALSSPSPTVPYTTVIHKSKASNVGAIAGGVVGGLIVLLVIILSACCIHRRKRKQNTALLPRTPMPNNNSPLANEDIEKDLKGSELPDQEYNIPILEQDAHETASSSNIPADTASKNEIISQEDHTSFIGQTEKGKPENTSRPDNPLLKHMPKM